MARGQLVMCSLPGQEWRRTALSPAQERSSIVALPIAVMVVASPARAHRSLHLECVVDHFERINHDRIVGTAHSVAHQLEEAGIHHIARLEVNSFSGSAVVDADCFVVTALLCIRISALWR